MARIDDYANLVRQMRDAQREYFSTRDRAVLSRSKELERRVDADTARILEDQQKQLWQ